MRKKNFERVFKVDDIAGFSIPGSDYLSKMLIDSESVGSEKINLNYGKLKPGKDTGGGSHPCPYDEIYYILRGLGKLTLGDKIFEVSEDTVIYINCDEHHKLENIGRTDLEILTIFPLPLGEGINPVYDERKNLWGTSFKKTSKMEAE